jgi:hypothetical protein
MIFGRKTGLALAAAALTGLLYTVSKSGLRDDILETVMPGDDLEIVSQLTAPKSPPAGAGPAKPSQPVSAASATSQTLLGPPEHTLSGPKGVELSEVLRFDITSDWIVQHWARISTITSQPDLVGYRVPVVTGTRRYDLTGSLTYYFDAKQKAKRIEFHGTTGDPQLLVELLTRQYDFRPHKTSEPGVQVHRVYWNGKAISELRLSPARIVAAEAALDRYDVHLLLERPAELPALRATEQKWPKFKL